MSNTRTPSGTEALPLSPDELKDLEQYRAVFGPSPLAVWLIWRGTIIFANDASLTAESNNTRKYNRPIAAAYHSPRFLATVNERIERRFTTGEALPATEERFVCVGGTPVDVEVAAWTIPFGSGNVLRVSFVATAERKATPPASRASE